jgi:signal transduction histidine kinase
MKLARRLTLFLVAGMVVVLAISSGVSISRMLVLFESDMIRDHQVLGHALAASAAMLWTVEGEARAAEVVEAARAGETEMTSSWRLLDGSAKSGDGVAELPAADWEQVKNGREVHRVLPTPGAPTLVSAFPVEHPGTRAAVEIRESLAVRDAYVRGSIRNTLLTALALIVLSSVLAAQLGLTLVGRPVHALVEQARRIGRGDLTGHIEVKGNDELGELGREMNAMVDLLREANRRVEEETRARIAALDQLRHADRLMTVGRLASGIAHELGTPLNVVAGRAKLIVKAAPPGSDAADNARIIGEQADRMTTIIRQLLDFARARGPKKALTELSAIVEQVATLLAPLAAKRSVTIETRAAPGVPRVSVDTGQMQQVLTNLVVNAIHATTGPAPVRLELSKVRRAPPPDIGGPEREWVRIDVADRGTGMPPEVIEHVFEPFFTTKDVGEGTGLGLSVAYGIVREHQGFIEVESTVGAGSRFSVHLPVESR